MRKFSNWTFKDVTDFLKAHGFEFSEFMIGSHQTWINKETEAVVNLNFHGNKHTFPELTLLTMIRQSKIDRKEWRNWTK